MKKKLGRPVEEPSKVLYCRLKLTQWNRFQQLGGKEWLLQQLADDRKKAKKQ